MNVMEVFNDSQAEVRRLSPLFAPGSMTPARARFWRHDVGRLMLLDFMHRKFDEILVRSRRARPAQVLGIGTPNGCSILRHELRAISHDFHKRGFPYAGDFFDLPLGHEQKAFWCVDSKVGESIDGPIGQSAAMEHASLRFAAFEHVSFRFLTRDRGGRAHHCPSLPFARFLHNTLPLSWVERGGRNEAAEGAADNPVGMRRDQLIQPLSSLASVCKDRECSTARAGAPASFLRLERADTYLSGSCTRQPVRHFFSPVSLLVPSLRSMYRSQMRVGCLQSTLPLDTTQTTTKRCRIVELHLWQTTLAQRPDRCASVRSSQR